MTTHQYYYALPSAPINAPSKQSGYYAPAHYGTYSHIPASPPERAESVTTSGVASYDPSATASSYAGSASEYDSATSTGSVDLLAYMSERLNGAFDPLPLDRTLVTQAQTSGELNAKTRRLMELQAMAQQRLAAVQLEFADGIKSAREVQRDLQWTQKRVTALNQRAARKYPQQFAQAQQKYPPFDDY